MIRPGGHFVFTAEAVSDDNIILSDKGYRLLRNGRFGYSKHYLDDIITQLGEQFRVEL